MVCIACGNNTKEDTTVTASEVIEDKTAVVSPGEGPIPTVDYDGLEPYLTKDNDSTYVVNFWATWCKPCIKEMPYFERIQAEYAKEKVQVVFVSLDFPDKLNTQVIPFIEKNNIQSKVILLDDSDANSWIPKVSQEWSGAIPATVIYKGKERKFYERSFSYEELKKEVTSIL